jgi:uncharacterized membrane protein
VLLVGGSTVAAVGFLGLLGRLPPNDWAGIRTRFTRSSDEHWYATHRAAAPIMIFGAIPVAVAAFAFLPFVLLGEVGMSVITGLALGSAAIILVTTIAGAWYGVAHAKSHRKG